MNLLTKAQSVCISFLHLSQLAFRVGFFFFVISILIWIAHRFSIEGRAASHLRWEARFYEWLDLCEPYQHMKMTEPFQSISFSTLDILDLTAKNLKLLAALHVARKINLPKC